MCNNASACGTADVKKMHTQPTCLDNLDMAPHSSPVQRGVVAEVDGVDLGPLVQQVDAGVQVACNPSMRALYTGEAGLDDDVTSLPLCAARISGVSFITLRCSRSAPSSTSNRVQLR